MPRSIYSDRNRNHPPDWQTHTSRSFENNQDSPPPCQKYIGRKTKTGQVSTCIDEIFLYIFYN